MAKVGAELDWQVLIKLEALLLAFVKTFAWSYEDMPGIDQEIIEYHLNVDPKARPMC